MHYQMKKKHMRITQPEYLYKIHQFLLKTFKHFSVLEKIVNRRLMSMK